MMMTKKVEGVRWLPAIAVVPWLSLRLKFCDCGLLELMGLVILQGPESKSEMQRYHQLYRDYPRLLRSEKSDDAAVRQRAMDMGN